MKKIFLFFLSCMLATSSIWAASDVVLSDYEDNTTQGWTGWGTTPVSADVNPSTTGNTSANVFKYDQTGGSWSGFAHWYNTPFTFSDYSKITIDVYVVGETGLIKLAMDNSVSGGADFGQTQNISTSDAWVHLEFDISGLSTFDYRQIAFQGSKAVVYYIDNITLVAKSAAPPTSIELSPASITAIEGKNILLAVIPTPVTASNTASFASNNASVSVDQNGIATTVSAGEATITATSIADPLVTNTATITVTKANTALSQVLDNFDNSKDTTVVWSGQGVKPGMQIIVNPNKTGNPSDSVLSVTNCRAWGGVAVEHFDPNLYNYLTFKVYSTVDYTDFGLKVGINNAVASLVSVDGGNGLVANTWTEMKWVISTQQIAAIGQYDDLYFQLSSNGATATGYDFLIDDIQLVAGSDFYPVSSFLIQGLSGVNTIALSDATLQMEAKSILPFNATNKTLVWSTSDADIATIDAATGLLTAVSLGTVTVTAQADGGGVIAKKVITIAKSSDASLKTLSVSAGTISPAFNKSELAYIVTLPSGTTTVPANIITALATSTLATVTITQPITVTGQGTVVVTAEDGTVTTYTITIKVAAATNADLATLSVDPGSLTFDANTLTYAVTIPYATTAVTVTYTKSDVNATVVKSGDGITSNTIEVTAADGTTKKTYTINYTKENPSIDATLSSLSINGGLLTNPTLGLTLKLPAGTSIVPTIIANVNFAQAKAVVTPASSLSGNTTVVVTAEDGITTKTYTIAFYVISDNSALTSLAVSSGRLSPVFSASTKTYTVELAAGTTAAPTVTAVAASTLSTVAITNATSPTGTASVKVTAENGSISTYTVAFSLATAAVTGVTVVADNGFAPTIQVKGGTLQMKATVAPATATIKTVTWSVEAAIGGATTLATISSTGLLKAAGTADGMVKVIATSTDGAKVGQTAVTISNQTVGFEAVELQILQIGNVFTFNGSAQLINVSGKVIATGTTSIDASSVTPGIYFLVIDGLSKEVIVK